jgi:hypothetical protein
MLFAGHFLPNTPLTVVFAAKGKTLTRLQLRLIGAVPPQFGRKGLRVMKNHAPFAHENVAVKDILLDTIVSAHYLVLQMRMLTASGDFAGQAETEVMADALSRWAQIAGAKWGEGAPDAQSWQARQ